ncbi:hypothetical protein Tco_1247412 [Tanacetum coccineum]
MAKGQPKKKKARKDVFTVNLHFDGIFTSWPLKYAQGQVRVITDTNFDEMSYEHLKEIAKKLVPHALFEKIYYCQTGVKLTLGLREIKSTHDIVEIMKVGYESGNEIDMYVEYFGYDIMELIKLEVNEEHNHNSIEESDDEYFGSDDYEEIENVDFHTEGDESVCGDSLDGIFCQRCTCKSCGKGAHIGYNCPPKTPIISNPEPTKQTVDKIPQARKSVQIPKIFGQCQKCGCNEYDGVCFYCKIRSETPNVLTPYSSNNTPDYSNPSPQPPTHSYENFGNNVHYGYDCSPQVPFIQSELCYNQDFNFSQNPQSLQQQFLCCNYCGGPHETFQCQQMNEDYYHEQNPCYDSNSFGFDQFQPPQYTVYHQILNSQNEFFNSQNEQFNSGCEHLNTQITTLHDLIAQAMQKKEEEKRIAEEQAAKERYWKIPICDDDDDYTIAITPVLSTEEPVNSLIMENEHLDTISATESDEFIKSSVEILVPIPSESKGVPKVCDVPFHDNSPPLDISKDQSEDFSDSNVDSTSTDEDSFSSNDVEYVEASPPNSEPVSSKVMEIVIPEVGRIEDDILLIKDDTLREKLLNVNRLVAKIKALKDNPVPSSVVVTKSTSTFPNLFLEETNTFDNSLPESETFCFNLEEPSSGSPTTPSDLSLPDYEAFSNDHIEETSSGSTTTYSDSSFSKYDSFIFDLSINSYHPSNRSDFHEEFADELAQIISQPEYDCFFKDEPELGNFTMDVVGNIFQKREPRVHVLNVLPTLELDFIPSSESIFAYVVWIFLPFLFIPVIPPYLLSCGDEDTIFDPGISKDCPDCEDSQFCHSSRVSHPQLHLGIRYPNLID